jgi:hypothetical protein
MPQRNGKRLKIASPNGAEGKIVDLNGDYRLMYEKSRGVNSGSITGYGLL